MRYRALNNAPQRRYLKELWNFGYGLLVKRKENICLFGNVITLKIALRNEIPGNNGLFKDASTQSKVWLPNKKKTQFQKLL